MTKTQWDTKFPLFNSYFDAKFLLIMCSSVCSAVRESPSSPVPHLAAPPITTTTEGWWLGKPRPYFADSPTNHTVISGQSAYLPCRVHMLGDRSVTWMRGRDLHILTVGPVTYSADDRFQVLHSSETDDWTLHVQYSQPRDSGTYKCQVNSDPKIARNVYLSVTDKRYLDGNLYKMPATNSERGRS
ncbi:uncharacterized protein [Palaemon carinicauda]|uniref:uncharacterized protein n=1 Tax=Palaemon carinicauda TaxID=392227 RepID=UPI0035B646C2